MEDFDFLGYTFGPRYTLNGKLYLGARPSMKSLTRIKGKISDLLRPCEMGAWPQVRRRLNRLIGGWSAYFGHGTLNAAYRAVDRHVCDRVRRFLNRAPSAADEARALLLERSLWTLGVQRLTRDKTGRARREPDMNSVGKPDAANPHVRFDERGRETEPLAKPHRRRALPRLYKVRRRTCFVGLIDGILGRRGLCGLRRRHKLAEAIMNTVRLRLNQGRAGWSCIGTSWSLVSLRSRRPRGPLTVPLRFP